ncbi:unnamed protein product [Didymodactylos carnosus]|uniref:NAD(P)(+)--arginine ADP-ribosyltransferase n=1 Tax=Didymodactylos carnosus TaxID=1234261 RepID=A0A815XRG4_9BILA|nr:unnamed protein product [Didymodactylos carnosus]CAF1561482.1 unnamed protein product [Didymodactylos carnosus]CAF4202092.1 unnamed protein product [Didymodactylos carnosus]CAF4423026.1 unnamed protein product [Didymodactylos carnosus]
MASALNERRNPNPRYLLASTHEPKQTLEPITGYAGEPLLSLEKACEPLLLIVPRLSLYVSRAKEESKDPADNLTPDESAAIRLYTMEWDQDNNIPCASLYFHLNETLRKKDQSELRPWYRYLKLFLTALAKLPPMPVLIAWRGTRNDQRAEYPKGAEFAWWAFSSCTTSLGVLESDLYLGKVGNRTIFSIETFNGRSVRDHSQYATEDEILLLPGTYFEVISHFPSHDLCIVHLQQKRPPRELLEPPFEGKCVIAQPCECNDDSLLTLGCRV